MEVPYLHGYTKEEILDSIDDGSFKELLDDILSKEKISTKQQSIIDKAIENAIRFRKLDRVDYDIYKEIIKGEIRYKLGK